MKGARGSNLDETQAGNEGDSRGQWMKQKGGMKGAQAGNA